MQTTGVTLAEAESARIRLDLQTAIQVGAANDFALKSIRHEQATIRKLITERWRRYLPSVGVSVIRNRSINDSAPDSTAHEIRLTVEQVIYDGGQRGLDLDLARLDALLSRHDFYITYNELRLNVIEAYLAVLAARGKIILNRKSLERARLQLKHTLLEEKVGFTTRAQVYLVAARVREIELAMQTAHNDYTQAVHDLKQVLNLDFEVQLEVVGNLYADYYLLPPRADLNELVDRARSERPEARRSLALIHRLRKEKEMVESEWIPRISVSGYTNRTGDSYPLRERGWGANITITFPLGSHSGSSDAGVDYSRNNQDRASNATNSFDFYDDVSYERRLLERRIALGESISDYNRLHNSLAIEINRNYDQMRESWEAIRIGNGRVYFQFTSLRILQTRYEVGDVRRVDIVEAERDLVSAQEDLTDAITEYLLAVYNLEFSAALEPDELGLTLYRPGHGNTLPLYLLREDLEQIQEIGESEADSIREYLEDDTRSDLDDLEDRYLIDEVQIDENPAPEDASPTNVE